MVVNGWWTTASVKKMPLIHGGPPTESYYNTSNNLGNKSASHEA